MDLLCLHLVYIEVKYASAHVDHVYNRTYESDTVTLNSIVCIGGVCNSVVYG